MRISFDKVYGYIEKHGRNRYASLFYHYQKYERTFDRIKYLVSQKSNISDIYYHNFMKFGINSYDGIPPEKNIETYKM